MPENNKRPVLIPDNELINAAGGAGEDNPVQDRFLQSMRLRCPNCSRRLAVKALEGNEMYDLECTGENCGFKKRCYFRDAMRYII